MIYDNIVIGSSFSALGCIIGLLKLNKKVLCIDGSQNSFEESNQTKKTDFVYSKQNIPIKKFNFKNKSSSGFNPVDVLESYSFGGLSNVWGASSLRYFKSDFFDWPISYNLLKEYYDDCEKIMNVSHFDDDISKELEIDSNELNNNKIISFSEFIIKFLKNKHTLKNLVVGYSRIALGKNFDSCGCSSYGCENCIFSTKRYLNMLIKNGSIEYKKNLIVKKFIQKDDHIQLEFENSKTDNISTRKLYLGAGSVKTPRIVLNSTNINYDLNLKESQVFFVPGIFFGERFINKKKYHTLCQSQFFFKENEFSNIGKISYQIKYDPKLTKSLLKQQFGFLNYLVPKFIINRIFLISGFIHSNHSSYSVTINSKNSNYNIFESKKNLQKIKFTIKKQLKSLQVKLRFFLLSPFLKVGGFGISYHLGGTIPMKDINNCKKNEADKIHTNLKGELSCSKNVFIIDTSCFPSVPAGSISLTIMANALRIAIESWND